MRIAILSICLMGFTACGPALTPQERFRRTVRSHEEERLPSLTEEDGFLSDVLEHFESCHICRREFVESGACHFRISPTCPDWAPNTGWHYRRPNWEGSLVEVQGPWILIELDGPKEMTSFEGEIWFDLYRDQTYKGRAQIVDEFGRFFIGYVTTAIEGHALEVGDRADTQL